MKWFEVLSYFSKNYPLQYYLPLTAMGITIAYYVLRLNPSQQLLGVKGIHWARRILLFLLAITALLAVENYRANDYYRFNSYLNAYEFYHYYIGTKYAREVGYTDMYAASLIADSETGMKWKDKSGTIRDLSSGRHIDHKQVLENAAYYKSKFSPERWEEFKKDIVWFKDRLVQYRWNGILRDKGYNGTPVWSMLVGGLLSNRISTDSTWGMAFLALLDPILILITFFMVVWAFGLRTAFLMITLLGTHYMMKWWHMKGAYLRTDWAMCMVMSVCLIRKQKYASAGILTSYAALSRIFPAVMVFGIGAHLLWNVLPLALAQAQKPMKWLEISRRPFEVRLVFKVFIFTMVVLIGWMTKNFLGGVLVPWLSQDNPSVRSFFDLLITGEGNYLPGLHLFTLLLWLCIGVGLGYATLYGIWFNLVDRRLFYFLTAFAITALLLLGTSLVYWRGTNYWAEYNAKISKHSQDISTWRVGYKYIFMADFGTDFKFIEKPIKSWQPVVRPQWYTTHAAEWWRTQLWILFLALLACFSIKDYRAYLVGFVPLFFLVSPTYYYYIMLLVPLLFFAPRLDYGRYALGILMLFLSGMAGFWFYSLWQQGYGTYYWLSIMIMCMTLYMLFLALTENLLFFVQHLSSPRNQGDTPVLSCNTAIPSN